MQCGLRRKPTTVLYCAVQYLAERSLPLLTSLPQWPLVMKKDMAFLRDVENNRTIDEPFICLSPASAIALQYFTFLQFLNYSISFPCQFLDAYSAAH